MSFQALLHCPKSLPACLGKAAYSPLRVKAEDYLIRWQPSPWVYREGKAQDKLYPATLVRHVYLEVSTRQDKEGYAQGMKDMCCI